MANYGETGVEPQSSSGNPLLALTGAATLAVGALLYGAGTSTLSTLAHPGSAGKYLKTTSTTALAWGTIASSDVSGLTAWATKVYPADAAGFLTNDGAGNLSWAAAGSGSYLPLAGGTMTGQVKSDFGSGTLPTSTYINNTQLLLGGPDGCVNAIEGVSYGNAGPSVPVLILGTGYGGTRASVTPTPSGYSFIQHNIQGWTGSAKAMSIAHAIKSDGLWSTGSNGFYHTWYGIAGGSLAYNQWMTLQGGNLSLLAGRINAATSTTNYASITLPHGVAPTSPLNGDLWTTSSGLFAQINGATVGPFLASVGSFLPITGGTLTGNMTLSPASGTAKVLVNAITGQTSSYSLSINSNEYWQVNLSLGVLSIRDVFNTYNIVQFSNSNSSSSVVTFGGTFAASSPSSASVVFNGGIAVSKGMYVTGKINCDTPSVISASFNIPHGNGPTFPVNGDLWTTTSGAYARINGVTTQLSSGSGYLPLSGGTLTGATIIDTGSGSLTYSGTPSLLFANSDNFTNQISTYITSTGSGWGCLLLVDYKGGTRLSPAATPSSAGFLSIQVAGYSTLSTLNQLAYAIYADGIWSGLSTGIKQIWYGTPSGSMANAVWMTLQGGNLTLATGQFNGSGAGLTSLSATNITTGTLNASRLPASAAQLGVANIWTATQTFAAITASDGSGLLGVGGVVNRIINGDMRIDQRNKGVSFTIPGSVTTYGLDRWQFYCTQASKLSTQQLTTTPFTGFTHYQRITSLGAYTPLAGELFYPAQPIEGYNVGDLMWGTASAKPITIFLRARSSLTGTFSGCIKNGAGARGYPFTFSIPVANTETLVTINVPGDTTGTWATDNTTGLIVSLDMGSGATYRATAGAWTAGNFVGATGAVNLFATSGATFDFTGVELYPGTLTSPPGAWRPYATEELLCRRYCRVYGGSATYESVGLGGIANTTQGFVTIPFDTPMRATPSLRFSGSLIISTYLNSLTVSGLAIEGSTNTNKSICIVATVSGATAGQASRLTANNDLSARIILEAEL